MVSDEKIISVDIYILTEKTWKICETICSIQIPVYDLTDQNLNRVNVEVYSGTSCQWSFNFSTLFRLGYFGKI